MRDIIYNSSPLGVEPSYSSSHQSQSHDKIVTDFTADVFGGWEAFGKIMHAWYVGRPWNFGYKCPNCDHDDFDVTHNKQHAGICQHCGAELISFFDARRTKRYFSRDGFLGKVLLLSGKPIGWVLGFPENLRDSSALLPDQRAFNLSYFCFAVEFRRSANGPSEELRRVIGSFHLRHIVPGWAAEALYTLVGKPLFLDLFLELNEAVRARGFNLLSAKISTSVPSLESLVRAAGFRRTVPWDRDHTKYIWVLQLR